MKITCDENVKTIETENFIIDKYFDFCAIQICDNRDDKELALMNYKEVKELLNALEEILK